MSAKRTVLALALVLFLGPAGAAATEIDTPTTPWAMDVDLQGVRCQDGRHRRQKLALSQDLLRAPGRAYPHDDPSQAHRAAIARNAGNQAFETAEGNGYATVQYVTETPVEGKPQRFRQVHRFWVHEGTRVEIHVSVGPVGPAVTPAEEARVLALLDEVRIPAAARTASYTDKEHGFALDLPSGWSWHAGGPSGIELRGQGEAVALLFEESRPNHWTLPLLMQAQDAGIRSTAGDAAPVTTRTGTGRSAPLEVRLYPRVGEKPGVSPFAGAVVLERGGVVLLGLRHKTSSAEPIARILASVRPIPAGTAASP
jgi:hypothetical protein